MMLDSKLFETYDEKTSLTFFLNNGEMITTDACLRFLPGKRLVLKGILKGKQYVFKLFKSVESSKKHYDREVAIYDEITKTEFHLPIMEHHEYNEREKLYLIVYECIQNADGFYNMLLGSDDKSTLLYDFYKFHQALSKTGFIQTDTHPNNFLYKDNKFYLIDLSTIKRESRRLPILENAACFSAQFLPFFNIDMAERYYQLNTKEYIVFKNIMAKAWRVRAKLVIDKCQRMCTHFGIKHTFRENQYYNRLIPKITKDLLYDSLNDTFNDDSHWLKKGNSSAVVVDKSGEWVIKRYRFKNWKIWLRRTLRVSRSLRVWKNVQWLNMLHIPTPEPLCVVEKKWGPFLRESYYVCRYIHHARTLDTFLSDTAIAQNRKGEVLDEIYILLDRLRALRLYHDDTKATNFLVDENDKVYFVDLDGLRQIRFQAQYDKWYHKMLERFQRNECVSERG